MGQIDDEINKVSCLLKNMKCSLQEEEAILKVKTKRIISIQTSLRPFSININKLVFKQYSDVFTEKWEKKQALYAMKSAMDWKNTEYKKQKVGLDKIIAERDIHLENIRILKGNIQHLDKLLKRIGKQVRNEKIKT